MRWAEPERLVYLWLVLLAVAALLFAARRRRKLEGALGDQATLRALTGEAGPASRWVRGGLLALAAALAMTGLARPLAGFRLVTPASRGADVVVAFDLSHSMEARDVRPDRLGASQREIEALLKALEGSSLGLVEFAGGADVLSPLSTDVDGLSSMVETAQTGDVEVPGSNLADALDLSGRLLHRPGDRPRAIVLVTDGENLQGDPSAGLEAVRKAGARLFTLGLGTTGGATIPIADSTGAMRGSRRGPDGNPVVTHLDENLLRDLARRGGGRYEHGDGSGRAALRLADAIRSAGGQEVRGQSIRAYDERFPWFAAAAGLLLLCERAVPRRRKR
jgi:Ca-activated chloride channel family protein